MTHAPTLLPVQGTAIQTADVYFNLHRGVWSCKSRKTGRVEHHARAVVSLDLVSMVVQQAGRAKVIHTGQKNVHAFARMALGIVSNDVQGWADYVKAIPGLVRLSYSPTYAGYFYRVDTKEAVTHVQGLYMLAPHDAPPCVLAYL